MATAADQERFLDDSLQPSPSTARTLPVLYRDACTTLTAGFAKQAALASVSSTNKTPSPAARHHQLRSGEAAPAPGVAMPGAATTPAKQAPQRTVTPQRGLVRLCEVLQTAADSDGAELLAHPMITWVHPDDGLNDGRWVVRGHPARVGVAAQLDLRTALLGDLGAVAVFTAMSKWNFSPHKAQASNDGEVDAATPAVDNAALSPDSSPNSIVVVPVAVTSIDLSGAGVRLEGLNALLSFGGCRAGALLSEVDLADNDFLAVSAGVAIMSNLERCAGLRRIGLTRTHVPAHTLKRIGAALDERRRRDDSA